jgi:hypothetical protein
MPYWNLENVYTGFYGQHEFENLLGQIEDSLREVQSKLFRVRLQDDLSNCRIIVTDIASSSGSTIAATYEYLPSDSIYVYLPAMKRVWSDRLEILIHETGHRHWFKFMTGTQRDLWDEKYVRLSRELVRQIQRELVSHKYTDYMDFVDQFSDPFKRLVAIHFANALMRDRVTPRELPDVILTRHPSTREFAQGRRSFSLIPAVSNRAGADVLEDYAEVYREYVLTGGTLSSIRDPMIRETALVLFKRATF